MKIKVKKLTFEQLQAIKPPKRKMPMKPNLFLRLLIKAISVILLRAVRFTYTTKNMEKTEGRPCLVLMNHSSFIDLEIASHILFPKPFCIVCTSDGFVGKAALMRLIGCIPTKKFVSDPALVANIRHALRENKCNVLMYPEASYSFDGRATALPRRLGLLLKRLDVPVVMITAQGAFARQPLYNGLKIRKVQVSATVECILSREDIKQKSVDELDAVLDNSFAFDNFAWQQKNKIKIDEPFRAEGLERILYKCAHCGTEGQMESNGTTITCSACGKRYELDEYGFLRALDGQTRFNHIPDWYNWEREEVKREIEDGSYRLETDVRIFALVDYKAVYDIGKGRLVHTPDGFVCTGCDGKLEFVFDATSSYGLYADYYWYEIGDVICIGDSERLYYCFPEPHVSVAKARMATEEIFKIKRLNRKRAASGLK